MKNILLIVLVCLCIWIVYGFYAKPTGTETIISSDPNNGGGGNTNPNNGGGSVTETPTFEVWKYNLIDYAKQLANMHKNLTGWQKAWLISPTTGRQEATKFVLEKAGIIRPLYIENGNYKYTPEDLFGDVINTGLTFMSDKTKTPEANMKNFIQNYTNFANAKLVYKAY